MGRAGLVRPARSANLRRMGKLALLTSRAVLRVTGADRVAYLNGLVSNDVALAAPGRAVWAALLTPQGKYLADFFIFAAGDALLLDCDAGQAPLVRQRLQRFRLRADVAIQPCAKYVHAAWPDAPAVSALMAPDPRLPGAGWRIIADAPLPATDDDAAYDTHRLALGLPDGARDMEAEKSVLLEGWFDALNGISWTKGCYMGQELTARTRYRGLIKRRLMPVRGADLPAPGTKLADGGEMRSSRGELGMALLRLEGEAGLEVVRQEWMEAPAIAP